MLCDVIIIYNSLYFQSPRSLPNSVVTKPINPVMGHSFFINYKKWVVIFDLGHQIYSNSIIFVYKYS